LSIEIVQLRAGNIIMSRISESKIGIAALRVLQANPNGEAFITDVKLGIAALVSLSEEDHAKSLTRQNEEVWEQQVRNLVSHREAEGNIFAEGYAEYADGDPIRITDAGKAYLRSKGY
jgi:hypothetical protein